jgi:hypothetical protein
MGTLGTQCTPAGCLEPLHACVQGCTTGREAWFQGCMDCCEQFDVQSAALEPSSNQMWARLRPSDWQTCRPTFNCEERRREPLHGFPSCCVNVIESLPAFSNTYTRSPSCLTESTTLCSPWTPVTTREAVIYRQDGADTALRSLCRAKAGAAAAKGKGEPSRACGMMIVGRQSWWIDIDSRDVWLRSGTDSRRVAPLAPQRRGCCTRCTPGRHRLLLTTSCAPCTPDIVCRVNTSSHRHPSQMQMQRRRRRIWSCTPQTSCLTGEWCAATPTPRACCLRNRP